jgi:gamma-glutamylcyclotransferase (GGCT)/AIG2-like uncharacterized protein YtfP
MSRHLFLYGTLLPELAPPAIAAAARRLARVGKASLPGRLHDLGAFPGAILDPAARTRIAGAVFALPGDPELLAALDAYEGFLPGDPARSLFVRVRAAARLEDGCELSCWVYEYNRDPGDAPLVPGGDYLAWKRRG